MNEFNDIERELEAAFTQRPTALSRPSLRDVKQRARRHQRQRSAGVLGACALVGVGGVAVLAQRSPASQTAVGESAATFIASATCYTSPTTIVMTTGVYDTSTVPMNTDPAVSYTTFPEATAWTTTTSLTVEEDFPPTSLEFPVDYRLVEGDFPGLVADMFGITVAELDAANVDVPGYGPFAVGTVIRIPVTSGATTTTEFPVVSPLPAEPCDQIPTPSWRCFGEYGAAADSTWRYFDYCEPLVYNDVADNGQPVGPTTSSIPSFTKIGTAIQVANCSNQEDVAAYLSKQLAEEGFTLVEPDTCTIDLPITKVIYNPDDPLAFSVALTLSVYLNNAVLEPSGPVLPTLTLGTWAYGSGVLVLLGDDLAGKTLAEIAYPAAGTPATSTFPPDTGATVTTCVVPSQMTLPPPATSTTMPGYQYC